MSSFVVMFLSPRYQFSLLSLLIVISATHTAHGLSIDEPTASEHPSQDDWPRMLGPNGDSTSPAKGIRTDWNRQNLPIRWIQRTGVGYGNGVAADGRWFQFDRFGNVERLTCFGLENGAELWRWEHEVTYRDMYGYNDGPRCSPVVSNGLVYVYGVAGLLACLDVRTGSLKWMRQLNEEYGVVPNFFGVGSAPVAYGSLVLTMVGGSPESSSRIPLGRLDLAKPHGTAMVAFDSDSGREVYRVGNYLASYSAPIIARIDGVDWCLALMREGLLAFHAVDGSQPIFYPWRSETFESVNAASPVVFGNRILISECYSIGSIVLELKEGAFREVWRDSPSKKDQFFRAHWGTPVRVGNWLFGSSGRNEPDSDFRCIDFDSGTVRWTKRNRERATCLLVDDHIIALGEYGQLRLLSPIASSYEQLAEIDLEKQREPMTNRPLLEHPCWSPPALSRGLLMLRGPNHVVALELIPSR